ncbi:hypothetical protein SDC9_93469 [bioreactor metagenome]|uniref:Uncharacterized protein n=1 Tax=bioreactor metagenome TaxID=1076179 RepID=A0A645A7C0_9ZZZZ
MIGQDLRAVFLGGAGGAPDHLPAVDGAVFDEEGSADAGVDAWLAFEGGGHADLLDRDAGLVTSREEVVRECQVVLGGRDEQPTSSLDRTRVDPRDDRVLLGAFGRGVRIADDVASP